MAEVSLAAAEPPPRSIRFAPSSQSGLLHDGGSLPHICISSHYDFEMDAEDAAFAATHHIARSDVTRAGEAINSALYLWWPCPLCYCLSILLVPCTLGLSAIFLRCTMIAEAEKQARAKMAQISSTPVFANAGATWDLESAWRSSVVLRFSSH